MKRKYPKSNRQCIEPKPSKSRRGGVSEVNMGGRAEVKFGSKMTQNGLSQEERERLKKAHTERLAKMNQSKENLSSKPEGAKEKPTTEPNVEPESKSDTKTDEDVIQEPEIPVADDKSADIISDNTDENTDNPKTVEITNDSNEIDTPP